MPADDTPRDPLAARPLTESEIARLRSYMTDPKAYRTRVRSIEARQWIAGLLATIDATRPSGDEALFSAISEALTRLPWHGGEGHETTYVPLDSAIVAAHQAALAAPVSPDTGRYCAHGTIEDHRAYEAELAAYDAAPVSPEAVAGEVIQPPPSYREAIRADRPSFYAPDGTGPGEKNVTPAPVSPSPDPRERAWCICGRGVLPENWSNHLLSAKGEHRLRTPVSPSPDEEGLRALEREYNAAVANGLLIEARYLDRRIRALRRGNRLQGKTP